MLQKKKKTGLDTAKIASKRVVQETAEVTGDLIGNKTADKVTSLGKYKNKEKEKKRITIDENYHRLLLIIKQALITKTF